MPVPTGSHSRPTRHRAVAGGAVSDRPALAGIVDTAGSAGLLVEQCPAANPATTRGRRAEPTWSLGLSAAASRSGRLRPVARPRSLLPGWSASTLACAALAACWALLGAAPAQGQNTVWSTTLTVAALGGTNFGCTTGVSNNCSDTAILGDDDFTLDSTNYSVTRILLNRVPFATDTDLIVRVSPALPAGPSQLALNVDGAIFPLSEGTSSFEITTSSGITTWTSTGLNWSQGDSIKISLVDLNVWSATLTVKAVVGASDLGCSNVTFAVRCSTTANLGDDDFFDSSAIYSVQSIVLRGSGRLDFRVSPNIVSGTNRLVLAVGDTDPVYLPLSDPDTQNADTRRWFSTGLNWSVGDTVRVKLVDRSDDPPLAPATPVVTPVSGTTDSLAVSWSVPANIGRPAITGYDLRYREGTSGSWTNGPQDVTGTSATLTGLQGNTGHQVQVRATNTNGDSGWSAPPGSGRTNTPPNTAPTVANPIPNQPATAGTPFSYAFPANTFSDGDPGDTLTYTATQADGTALPAWLSFTAGTRTFAGTPQAADEGTVSVRVTASDGRGGSVSDIFDIRVNRAGNSAPTVASAIRNQLALVGTPFSHAFPANTFSDADNDSLTYTATQVDGTALPAWLSFTADTRTFAGTPGTRDAGAVTVAVTASDGHGGSVSYAFEITVNPADNSEPVVTNPIPDFSADLNTGWSFKFPSHTFRDADPGDTLTYTATQADGTALPAWLSFDAGNRYFRGTPRAADTGTVSVRVTASDGNGGAVSDTFTITVGDVGDLEVDFGTAAESKPLQAREGGARVQIPLLLDGRAPQALTIPLEVTHVGGATAADYTGIPASVTIAAGAKNAGFGLRAIADGMLEPGEGLRIDFGQLPAGVRKGTWGPYEIIEFVDGPAAQAQPSVEGPLLTLVYPGALEGGSKPSGRDFVVTAEAAGGARALVAVTAVAVRGSEVLLDLDRPVTPGETVTLSYLAAAMHPIRDTAGLPLPLLASEPVRNDTGASGPLAEAAPAGGSAFQAPLAAVLEAAREGAGSGRLDLSSRNLTDVSALAGLTGLRELDLGDNAITDASPLAGLAALERLNLAGNRVADLWPLAGLTGLRVLDLAGNRIADIAALEGLAALERLDLAENRVADVWPLAGLAELRTLDLAGNRIADIATLAGLAALERLNLAGNRIRDIATLARLGWLEVLLLDRNRVADVAALSQLAGLAHLGLAGNRIGDIAALAELGGLRRLDLAGNEIADVAALGDVSGLVWLRLPGNPVSSAVPLARLEHLRWLWLDPGAAPGPLPAARPLIGHEPSADAR